MTSWLFTSDAEGWTTGVGTFQWNASEGIVPGCLWINNAGGDETTSVSFAPATPSIGDPVSFWARVTANTPESTPSDNMLMQISTGFDLFEHLFEADGILGYDSGWVRISGAITTTDAISSLQIIASAISGGLDVYIDKVYFRESDGLTYAFTRSAGGVPGSVAI